MARFSDRFYLLQLLLSTRLVATILLFGILSGSSIAQQTDQQLKEIQQHIVEKEKSVKQQQQQRKTLQTQLQEQEKNIAKIGQGLHTTRQQLSSLNQEMNTLSTSISQLKELQTTQQQQLAKQLDAAFRQGKSSALQLLLSGEESQRNERILTYFNYLNQARKNAIQELEKTQKTLSEQKITLQQKQIEQKKLFNLQKNEQEKLEVARKARKTTLQSLEVTLQQDQQKLTELKQNEARMREKIAKAERAARARAESEAREVAKLKEKEQQAKKSGKTYTPTADERALMSRTGGLGKPTGQNIWPVKGQILHQFGESQQGELRWKGMVISATEGSEVKAIAAGRVLLADWLEGYGLVVVVEHGQGDMSLYGYNQNALVSVGSQVQAGQAIALVGNSGGQGRAALYFEIRRQGQAVNPRPWLKI